MTNKHTALPWHQGTDIRQIESSVDGTIVCLVQGAKSHPATLSDAQLIVTAVNYHDRLLEALTLAVDFINKHPADPDITSDQVEAWQKLVKANPDALLAEIDNLENGS